MPKLYKYVPFTDGSKAILTEGTIKFSCSTEFNDPFDCQVKYDIEKSMEYYSECKDLIKEIGDQFGYTPAQRVINRNKLLQTIKNSMSSGDFHDVVLANYGICSLSLKSDNILMWSHYADYHKGFVVEFTTIGTDLNTNIDSAVNKLFGAPIRYCLDMPTISVAKRDYETFTDVLLKKSSDWEYEAEYRVVSSNGPGIHRFDPNLITKVIAGIKMTDSDFGELKGIVSELSSESSVDVHLVRARGSNGKYALDID